MSKEESRLSPLETYRILKFLNEQNNNFSTFRTEFLFDDEFRTEHNTGNLSISLTIKRRKKGE